MRDAAAMAESHKDRGDIELAFAFPEDLPGIQGDPHQLRQIFTNLLTNAFEAMNGAGRVRVSAGLLPAEEETLTVRATRDALAKLTAYPDRLLG